MAASSPDANLDRDVRAGASPADLDARIIQALGTLKAGDWFELAAMPEIKAEVQRVGDSGVYVYYPRRKEGEEVVAACYGYMSAGTQVVRHDKADSD